MSALGDYRKNRRGNPGVHWTQIRDEADAAIAELEAERDERDKLLDQMGDKNDELEAMLRLAYEMPWPDPKLHRQDWSFTVDDWLADLRRRVSEP